MKITKEACDDGDDDDYTEEGGERVIGKCNDKTV